MAESTPEHQWRISSEESNTFLAHLLLLFVRPFVQLYQRKRLCPFYERMKGDGDKDEEDILRLHRPPPQETLLEHCLQAILSHSTVEEQCAVLLNAPTLPLFSRWLSSIHSILHWATYLSSTTSLPKLALNVADLFRIIAAHPDNARIKSLIGKIISNFSLHLPMHQVGRRMIRAENHKLFLLKRQIYYWSEHCQDDWSLFSIRQSSSRAGLEFWQPGNNIQTFWWELPWGSGWWRWRS